MRALHRLCRLKRLLLAAQPMFKQELIDGQILNAYWMRRLDGGCISFVGPVVGPVVEPVVWVNG